MSRPDTASMPHPDTGAPDPDAGLLTTERCVALVVVASAAFLILFARSMRPLIAR